MGAIRHPPTIKERALHLPKETSDKQIRLSYHVLRDRWDLSDEDIQKICEYASSDCEVACDTDGKDLVFGSKN
jgi:hypothetical protein